MIPIIRAIETLSTIVGYIGAIVMAPLIVSMVYEVIARHAFRAPTFWAYEVGYILAGTCYLFGMAYCLKVGGHVRVDFVYEKLSVKGKALVEFIGYLVLMLPVSIWITYGLVEYAIEAYDYGEVSGESSWNPIIWPFRVVWVIDYLALTLQAFAELLKNIRILIGMPPYEGEHVEVHV